MTTGPSMAADMFLCDGIESSGNKLYAIGIGWDVIYAFQLPARHSRIGVGVMVHVPFTATNEPHRFTLRVDHEDGSTISLGDAPPIPDGFPPPPNLVLEDTKIIGIAGQINVGRPAELPHGAEQLVNLAIQLDGIMFDRVGNYSVVLELDGDPANRLPFRVQQPTLQLGVAKGPA